MSAHRGRSPDPFLYCSGCLACNSSVCEDNPPLPPTLARREGSMVEPASSCSSSDHLETGDTKSQSYPQRPASATPYTPLETFPKHFLFFPRVTRATRRRQCIHSLLLGEAWHREVLHSCNAPRIYSPKLPDERTPLSLSETAATPGRKFLVLVVGWREPHPCRSFMGSAAPNL